MDPGVVMDARWMSSISLRRASAQLVATSRSRASDSPCRMRSRNAISAAPSDVAAPAIQAPIESRTWSSSLLRRAAGMSPVSIRANRTAKSSIALIASELFRAAGVAEIGIGEERVERRPAADETLLVGIAQHRLQVLAVGRG